jgi:hypothetical protein
MRDEQNVLSVLELPRSGHLAFEFDESPYSLDYQKKREWFLFIGAMQIAVLQERGPRWQVSGAHDHEASSRHDSLPSALIAATGRY